MISLRLLELAQIIRQPQQEHTSITIHVSRVSIYILLIVIPILIFSLLLSWAVVAGMHCVPQSHP